MFYNSLSGLTQLKKKYLYKAGLILLVSGLLLLFFTNTTNAAVWLLDPTVTLEHSYDENFRLTTNSSQEDDVSTTRLVGELALKGKSERADILSYIRLDKIQYGGDDEDLTDRDNQLLGLRSKYKVSERNTFSLDGLLQRDSILRNAELQLNPGDVDPINGGLLNDIDTVLVEEDVRRTRLRVRPRWVYRLNENTNLGLTYRYRDLDFSGDSGTDLVESESHSISTNIVRTISEKDRVWGSLSASFFKPDSIGPDRDTDTYGVNLGLIHRFSETLTMDISAGVRDSEFDNASKSSDSGFTANIGATKVSERTNYRVNFSRNVAPSASGNQVEFNEIDIDIEYAITSQLNFNFNTIWSDSDSTDDENTNNDREYIAISPGLNWRFSPSWVASTRYRYREKDLDNGGSGDSSGAALNISYSPPRKF